MKIESPAFGPADLQHYLDELEDEERKGLADRLEAASAHLEALAPRIAAGPGGDRAWSGHEVLAHIAVLSKFYGMLVYKIGTGAMTELDLLGNVNLRDVVGEQLTHQAPPDLVALAVSDHRRTAAYLRSASVSDLRRAAALSHGGEITASEVARLPLLAHLEQHIRQLEAALA